MNKKLNRRNRRRPHYLKIAVLATFALLVVTTWVVANASPRFALRHVAVEGNKMVSGGEVRARLKPFLGRNVTRLDVGAVEKVLRQEPRLRTISVTKQLPDGMRISVQERVAWATLLTETGYVEMDANLVPFRAVKSPSLDLPRILWRGKMPQMGRVLSGAGVGGVRECLAWMRGEQRITVRQMVVGGDGTLTLFRHDGVPIQLGHEEELQKKLQVLGILLDKVAELSNRSDIAHINLYSPDHPAVRYGKTQKS
jgi:cell division protein FtsQ